MMDAFFIGARGGRIMILCIGLLFCLGVCSRGLCAFEYMLKVAGVCEPEPALCAAILVHNFPLQLPGAMRRQQSRALETPTSQAVHCCCLCL